MNITLRNYQQEIVDKVFQSRDRGIRRQLVVAFCGAGKSFTLLTIAKQYVENNQKVLIIMDQSDLVWQWKESALNLIPNVKVGVEKAEHRAKMSDQIVLTTPQTLGREGSKRIKRFDQDHFDLCLTDEADRSISQSWINVLEYFNFGKDSFDSKNLLTGCSVHKNSKVSIRNGQFNGGKYVSIEEAWNLCEGNIVEIGEYQLKTPKELESRGWLKNKFGWKKIHKIIRHKVKEPGTEIKHRFGHLKLTNDHSVYVIENGNIIEKKSNQVRNGDTLLIDNGKDFEGVFPSNIHDVLSKSNKKFFVRIQIEDKENILFDNWRKHSCFKRNYLPYKHYLENKDHYINKPEYLYYVGSSAKCDYDLDITKFAYLFGFWLGDGWFKGKSSIGFSIKNDEVEYFKSYVENIGGLDIGIEIKNNGKGAKDVILHNSILREIFDYYFKDQKHYNKAIPEEIIYNYSKLHKRKLISGLIDSDGWINKPNKRNKTQITITTTSKPLKDSLNLFLKTLNVDCGITITQPKKGGWVDNGTRQIIGKRVRYDIRFTNNMLKGDNNGVKGNRKKYNKDCIEVKVKNVKDVYLDGWVYDFEMAGHPSFVANETLVHNTATPYRTSGESMGILYDDVVGDFGIDYGLREGWLVDFEIHNVKTNTDISKVQKYGSKFNQTQLSEAVDNPQRNLQILKVYQQICGDEQAVVTCASVEHAYSLKKLFNENGITGEVIEANTDKELRKEYLKDFDDGKIKVLFHYNTISRGVDLTELRNLILARPIGSRVLFVQMLGRPLRVSQSVDIGSFSTASERKEAIENSSKPFSRIIDLHDKAGNHDVAHIPSLFGLHNELQVNKPQKFYSEVVEKLEELHREKGVDPSFITDLDDIDVIVKRRKFNIDDIQYDPKVEEFTNRRWLEVDDNTYEIIYSKDEVALIIEPDKEKKELIDVDGWKLVEYDQKNKISKELQTFNSISGAFNIADQYADQQGWNDDFVKQKPWMKKGVSSKQLKLMRNIFTYKNGYSKIEVLKERYPDTGVRMIKWKPTGEILSRGRASDLISNYFNNHK